MFQVKLKKLKKQNTNTNNTCRYIHVGFVVIADLLDSDVILGVNEWLCGRVCLGQSYNTGYVLELGVIIHLHLHAHKHMGKLIEQPLKLIKKNKKKTPEKAKYTKKIDKKQMGLPFQHRSGHGRSSPQRGTTACSPNIRERRAVAWHSTRYLQIYTQFL